MTKIYLITSPSSGSGKTTTALNLALCFTAMGKKCLILDSEKDSWLKKLLNPSDKEGLVKISPFFSYADDRLLDALSVNDYDIVLIDSGATKAFELMDKLGKEAKLLIPVEAEFYGMNDLPDFLKEVNERGIEIQGFVPLMFRKGSKSSEGLLAYLKEMFGNMVFEPSIQRNFYIAMQKDLQVFSQTVLTERAGVTYLNLANNLLEKNQ